MFDARPSPMPFHLRLRHYTNQSHALTHARPLLHIGLRINKAGILRFELRAGIWRTRRPCSLRESAVLVRHCRDAPESLAGW